MSDAIERHLLGSLLPTLAIFLFAWWAIGLHVIPWLESRDLAAGDPPPPYPMRVLAVEPSSRVVAVMHDGLDAYLAAHPGAVLTLPDAGELSVGEFDVMTWRVLERGREGDLVQLAHRSDDYTLTVRYRVAGRDATMLHARLSAAAYFFAGFGYALLLAPVVSWLLRRSVAHARSRAS